MEQGEQQVGLYDFLYRDSSRITSYYAQIFGGHLSSVEESDIERSEIGGNVKGQLALISGQHSVRRDVETGSKQTINPHDVITTDVLSYLQTQQRVNWDLKAAPHGSMLIAKGALLFVDRVLAEIGSIAVEAAISQEKAKPHAKQDKAALALQQSAHKFMTKVDIPSSFLLRTNDGIQIAGTIKDEGMEEPIPTYYFKHGTAGLADVFVICIKEVPSSSVTLPNTQLIGVSQQVAQALTQLIFPPEAIRVTCSAPFQFRQSGPRNLIQL